MPGMPPRKIDHIFQCLSVFLTFCPLSLLEKTSHLVCLPGKQASSFQKKASASDQPTGSVLLLTTIVSLIEFSFWIIAFRLSKHLLTAYTGSVALVTLLLKVPRNSGQQTCSARSSQMYCRTSRTILSTSASSPRSRAPFAVRRSLDKNDILTEERKLKLVLRIF